MKTTMKAKSIVGGRYRIQANVTEGGSSKINRAIDTKTG